MKDTKRLKDTKRFVYLLFSWPFYDYFLGQVVLHIVVVWHHSLLLINSFNKTDAAVFSCRLCFLRDIPLDLIHWIKIDNGSRENAHLRIIPSIGIDPATTYLKDACFRTPP